MDAIRKLQTGELESYEFDKIYMSREGTFNWGHISAKVHCNQKGLPQFVVSVTHDINKRKEFENLLNLVLRTIPSLVSYIDRELTYKFVNQSYEKWFGFSASEIIGKKLVDIIGIEAFEAARNHIDRALKGEYVEYERRLNYRYGGARDVHITFVPDFNPIGEVSGIVAIVTDITDLKGSDGMAIDQQSQLLDYAKRSVIGALASGIALQINEPLQALHQKLDQALGHIEKSDKALQDQLKDDFGKMKESGARISKIVKGLKSFSQGESEKMLVEINLAMMLEDAIALCRERFKNRGIDLFSEDAKDLRLKCNSAQIVQVLSNLLNNSCDAIENAEIKWVKISVHEEPNRILVSITDSGPGLSSEIATQLSAPFFTTKVGGKASGFGLSDSRGIVENHGGKLFYDSSSVNTRFVIELPREQNCVIVDTK